MDKQPEFESQCEGILASVIECKEENKKLQETVKYLKQEKELLVYTLSEMDDIVNMSAKTLELTEKLNCAYEYILKKEGFSFEEEEELL